MRFVLINVFLWCFLSASICQVGQIENIAYRNMRHIVQKIDTSVSVLTCDHHGNTINDTISIKLHLLASKTIAAAEILYANKEKYAFYYFEKRKLIMIERNYDDGSVEIKTFQDGISFKCLYNWDGAFAKAVLDLIK